VPGAVTSELDGDVVLVTGAGSGIGRASALALAAAGASVTVVDLDAGRAEQTAEAIRRDGGIAVAVAVDAAGEDGVDQMVRSALDEFGKLNHVHANAAVQWFGTVLECTCEEWDRMFALNLRGVFLLARRAIPELIRSGGGSLTATSSDCAVRTSSRAAAYTATKAGLNGLVRSIAVDFGAGGIRANTVTPGVTDTAGLRRLYGEGGADVDERIERAASLSPLGRIGRHEDVADVVVFLCSERARFITGSDVIVDGGMTVTYGAD
jgi:NAD(P)-dependent dehydrogenase (short-subunit alcohol dehydrogenase family)